MILDGATLARQSLAGDVPDLRALLLTLYPQASIPPFDHVVRTAAPLVARINHGVWIASCSCGAKGLPTPGCIVGLDLLLGWCVRCGNQAWGGGWRPIIAPPAPERHRIEVVLLCRPSPEDRNWEPDESVADLLAQNREHGDPAPDLNDDRTAGPLHGPDWRALIVPFGQRLRQQLGPRWWRTLRGRR